jgi:hypothetical protein
LELGDVSNHAAVTTKLSAKNRTKPMAPMKATVGAHTFASHAHTHPLVKAQREHGRRSVLLGLTCGVGAGERASEDVYHGDVCGVTHQDAHTGRQQRSARRSQNTSTIPVMTKRNAAIIGALPRTAR